MVHPGRTNEALNPGGTEKELKELGVRTWPGIAPVVCCRTRPGCRRRKLFYADGELLRFREGGVVEDVVGEED